MSVPGFAGQYDGLHWLGTEAAWVGSAPPTGARVIVRAGTAAGTTTAGAALTVSYTPAFPNGIVSLVVTPGDNANGLGFLQVPLAGQTLSAFTVFAWKATPAATTVISAAIRVNYVALGW